MSRSEPESPAALLERAATKVEQLSEHVSAGPWRANGEDDTEEEVLADNGHPGGSLVAKCGDFDDSLWIATMSPSVADPITALLRAHAEHCRVAVAQMETIRRGAPDVMFSEQDLVTVEGRAALALARAILGETEQGLLPGGVRDGR